MFTEAGLQLLITELVAALNGGQIVVTDGGENQDGASIDSVTVDGLTITVSATFGEDKANFDWKVRWVVVDQKVIDLVEQDLGRKAQGSVWSVDARIVLSALEE